MFEETHFNNTQFQEMIKKIHHTNTNAPLYLTKYFVFKILHWFLQSFIDRLLL